MTRQRFVALLCAAILAISAAVYFGTAHRDAAEPAGGALLPGLKDKLSGVDAVSILKGGAAPSVRLRKVGDRWRVAERGDYPADEAKLRRLLIALGDAVIVEQKSADPANYALLGVEDAAAGGTEISLHSADGERALLIGKTSGNGSFVRRAAEAQSLLVAPSISFETEPRYWIDARIADVDTALIQKIEVQPASGTAYALHRLGPDAGNFALDFVPAGREALEARLLAPAASAYTGLVAEDVAAAKDVDFGNPSRTILTLSNGSVITLSGAAVGEQYWITIGASADPAPYPNAAGRAYLIAKYRYDALFRPLEQLLKPKQ